MKRSPPTSGTTPSHRQLWWKCVFAVLCVGVIAAQCVVIAHRRAFHTGDFDVSREFGRRFLAGEDLYAGGLHYPYMPSAAMYFSPLAMVAPGVGMAVRYVVALAALWLTLRWLHTMLRDRSAAMTARRFTVAALTVVLASHYIVRDLDDGGPHLILLAVLVAAIFQVWKENEWLAGGLFGLATALKAPAGLFVPFFLWKRQWRLAAATSVAAAWWIVLPVLWMGPARWWTHQRAWTGVVAASVLGRPVPGAAESEWRVQNQALKPAVLRYLVTYPEGHPAQLSHPAAVPVLNLSRTTAEPLAALVVLGLLAAYAWWSRRPYVVRAHPQWLLESSGVLILMLLLSPVTWVQHVVFLLPALYLIVAEDRSIRSLGVPFAAAMAVYAMLAVVLNREVVGRELYYLLLSYHVHTLCMLLILAVIMLRRPTVAGGNER